MNDKVSLTVISAENQVFDGDVESVLVPGMLGDFLVLCDHADCVSTIRPGYLRFSQGEAAKNSYFVSGGIVEVFSNKVSILVDSAVPLENIKKENVRKLIVEVENLLSAKDIKNRDDLELRKNDLEEALQQI